MPRQQRRRRERPFECEKSKKKREEEDGKKTFLPLPSFPRVSPHSRVDEERKEKGIRQNSLFSPSPPMKKADRLKFSSSSSAAAASSYFSRKKEANRDFCRIKKEDMQSEKEKERERKSPFFSSAVSRRPFVRPHFSSSFHFPHCGGAIKNIGGRGDRRTVGVIPEEEGKWEKKRGEGERRKGGK